MLPRFLWVVVVCWACAAGLVLPALAEADDAPVSSPADLFLGTVEPLLRAKCVTCHGPDKQEGALRLDSRAAALRGGDRGPALVPGEPARSLLIKAVRHEEPDLAMPPKEKLSDSQIAALADWVKRGAAWPDRPLVHAGKSGPVGDAWSDPNNPIVRLFKGERLDLWSLKKPVRPERPGVKQADWVRTPIDAFVLARLEAAGLAPSPEADRAVLVRRLYYDLLGLPPEPEVVQAFVADPAPDAYERLVERLLASPHYGERWSRYWLDVVRYADTNAFERDEYRPNAWRYRDYVIRALNADKPYDQFVHEQLAGDEMLDGPASSDAIRTAADADKLIATTYLRLGPYDSTRSIFQEDAIGHDQLMADLVNTTGAAMLGMTLSCCQCHNHKYDPLAQADHYRMRAFFAAVKFRDDLAIDPVDVQREIEAHNARIDKQASELQGQLDQLLAKGKQRGGDALAALDEEERKRHDALKHEISELNGGKRTPHVAMAATDSGSTAPPTHVLYQGDPTQPRDMVEAGFFSALDPDPAPIEPPAGRPTTGRRSALARWITSPDNPLAARVMANRIWQHHFDRGIMTTANDFGYSGARPTHPALLDWLAVEFRESGWSIKHLHRLILLSSTYRQVSSDNAEGRRIDPDNALLWRQNLRRLDAETLRDALLAVAGRLRAEDGGKPRWPPVPEAILLAQPSILEAAEGKDGGRQQGWYADPLEATYVRSIFLVQKHTVPIPFLGAFDLPEMSTSCGRRNVTTVVPQALTLLNSPLAVAMARSFAARVEREVGSDRSQQVERAFWLALARAPRDEEFALADALLKRHAALHAEQSKAEPTTDAKAAGTSQPEPPLDPEQTALVDLCRALFNLNEFVYVD